MVKASDLALVAGVIDFTDTEGESKQVRYARLILPHPNFEVSFIDDQIVVSRAVATQREIRSFRAHVLKLWSVKLQKMVANSSRRL